MTKLTIIIVEYFCIADTEQAIASARNILDALDFEILVVSNSLYDEERMREVQERLTGAKVIFSKVNSGYAGGINTAITKSNAPYLFLLNPDAAFVSGDFSCLIDYMEANSNVAVIGPRVIDEDGVVQPSCRAFPKLWSFIFVRSILNNFSFTRKEQQRYMMKDFDRNHIRSVDWVSGGAMLVKRRAIEFVGMMDERYFLYMEDVDWCRAMKNNGFDVVFNPEVTLRHSGQHASISGGFFKKTTLWHFQSLIKYFLKYRK